ncbi:MAG: hypothetical protein IT529_07380 [Burkholderiales bacterium]|nr:hypothetical protein [Burkholderiales bacterium]
MTAAVHRVRVGPSVLLAAMLLLIHAGAALSIWLVPLAVTAKAVLTGAIFASLAWMEWSRAALRGAVAIVELETKDAGTLAFRERAGRWREAEILGSSYVSPWLTVLNLGAGGARRPRHVVLVPDNVDASEFRRLRAWLRWSAARAAGGPRET